MVVREGSDYIIEKLTQDKMMKEFIKGNKKLLASFDKYLLQALKSYTNLYYGDVSYSKKPEIFLDSAPINFNKPRKIMSKVFVSWDSVPIVKKPLKEANGFLVGLDLSKFDKKKGFEFDSSFGLNRHFDRRVGRYISSGVLFADVKDACIKLKECKGHLERREVISNLLNTYKFNLDYINKTYHNDLESFFLDGLISDRYVDRTKNWPDKIEVPGNSFGFSEDFFLGPYGKDFCDRVYNDVTKSFVDDFYGFELSPDYFSYLPYKNIAPWVILSFDDPKVENREATSSRGLFYYNLERAKELSSVSKIFNRNSIHKYLGFFDGSSTNYIEVGNPLEEVIIKHSDSCNISWT